MKRTKRGGTFWAFVFGVAFGATLGAVLMHKYLTQHTLSPVAPSEESPWSPPTPAPTPSPQEDTINRILREWRISPEEIRRQIDRAGQVIKREGGAITEQLDTATLDARIVAMIKAKYTLDAQLSAWDIAVRSVDGHVTLAGTVNTPDLVVRAVVLALDTGGVIDVVSSLRVKSSATPGAGGV